MGEIGRIKRGNEIDRKEREKREGEINNCSRNEEDKFML